MSAGLETCTTAGLESGATRVRRYVSVQVGVVAVQSGRAQFGANWFGRVDGSDMLVEQAVNHGEEMTKPTIHPLGKILESRIAIIDGATGTTIRTYGMKEADIRGERFNDAKKDLLNNGDLFTLTQPELIGDIHRRFLEAGADIIETNTFGATSIAQSEFFVDDPREHGGRKDPEFYQKVIEDPFLQGLAWEINEQSARQGREWADRVANATGRQRFVAGAMGPLTVSLSNSPDADDPGFRVVTFDQVKAAYCRAGAGVDRGRCGSAVGGDDLRYVERQGGAGGDSRGIRRGGP